MVFKPLVFYRIKAVGMWFITASPTLGKVEYRLTRAWRRFTTVELSSGIGVIVSGTHMSDTQ